MLKFVLMSIGATSVASIDHMETRNSKKSQKTLITDPETNTKLIYSFVT